MVYIPIGMNIKQILEAQKKKKEEEQRKRAEGGEDIPDKDTNIYIPKPEEAGDDPEPDKPYMFSSDGGTGGGKKRTIIVPEPTVVTGNDINTNNQQQINDKRTEINNANKQMTDERNGIDPSGRYKTETGEIITGQQAITNYNKAIATNKLNLLRMIVRNRRVNPSGKYVQRGDEYFKVDNSFLYVLQNAEPKERLKLSQSLGGNQQDFSTMFDKAHASLTPEEKETYGYRFTDWSSIKPEEIKYYPGGQKYLSGLTTENKEQLVTSYMGGQDWKNFISSTQGQTQRTATAQSIHEERVTAPDQTFTAKIPFTDIKLFSWKQPKGWEKYNVSTVAVYDYSAAEKQIAENMIFSSDDTEFFETLAPRTRLSYSFGESALNAVLFPVTIAQTGMKYITGKGSITDPFTRIKTGNTVILPDVGEILGENKISTTQGVISGGIGLGAEKLGWGKSNYLENVQKYPWESGAAAIGEFAGLYIGGKAVNVGKTATFKGLGKLRGGIVSRTGWNLPTYETYMAYRPTNLVRTAWWKAKEKLGFAEYKPEAQVWDPRVLTGETRFAEQPGAYNQLKIFEETRTFSDTGEILGIHASPSRFNPIIRIGKGTSESPGLSISAYGRGSPYFLKTSGYSGYSTSFS